MNGRPGWHRDAACRGVGPARFYPTQGGRSVDTIRRFCDRCTVRSECGEHGLMFEEHGVWGGTTPNDRERTRNDHGITVAAVDVGNLAGIRTPPDRPNLDDPDEPGRWDFDDIADPDSCDFDEIDEPDLLDLDVLNDWNAA